MHDQDSASTSRPPEGSAQLEGAELSASEASLLQRVVALPWTAHKIRLSEHVQTLPGRPEFISSDGRLAVAEQICRGIFGSDWRGLRIADLGCLEGGYSLAFALGGATVLGVEGRSINFQKCKLIEGHFALPNLRFVQDDVKNFTPDNYGRFDVVLVCGLLYHLDDPVAWLHQIAPCVKTLLFVDTHYAPESDATAAGLEPNYKLSELIKRTHQGFAYEGRWFREFSDDAPDTAIEESHWAAVSNLQSLWLTHRSLIGCLYRCGFAVVGERSDFLSSDELPAFLRENSRSCFFALKPELSSGRDPG